MTDSLRSQAAEERERLRQEHQRLLSMQQSLEAERTTLRTRAKEELAEVSRAKEEARNLMYRAEEEKERLLEDISEQRQKLEAERQEFARYVSNSTKASEKATFRLKEEEERIRLMREEVMDQQNALAQQRAAAAADLSNAALVRKELDSMRAEIESQKIAVENAARDIQRASEILHAKDQAIKALIQDIEEREKTLQDGFQQVTVAGDSVLHKESDLNLLSRQISLRQLELEKMEEQLALKRAALASSQREMLRSNPRLSFMHEESSSPKQFGPVTNNKHEEFERPESFFDIPPVADEIDKNIRKKSNAWQRLKSAGLLHNSTEIKLAKKIMSEAKLKLSTNTS